MFKTSLNQIKELRTIGKRGIKQQEKNKKTLVSNWIGMRTLKTGLSIILALYVSTLSIINTPFYVVMGTIFALQSTVKDSFTIGRNRIFGTLLGGFIAFAFACLPWQHPLLIGLAGIITIVICNKLQNSSSILIALTVGLSILISVEDQHPLIYSFFRTTDTIIGLTLGILVNYFVARPNYFKPVLTQLDDYLALSLTQLTQLIQSHTIDLPQLKQSLNQLDEITHFFLSDTMKDSPEAIHVNSLLEQCHDLRFYLKGLARCYEEGYQLPNLTDSRQKTPKDSTIPEYYLDKFLSTLQEAESELRQLKEKNRTNDNLDDLIIFNTQIER